MLGRRTNEILVTLQIWASVDQEMLHADVRDRTSLKLWLDVERKKGHGF